MKKFFQLVSRDRETQARTGKILTSHGEIQTPVFMPVGTQGTVKSVTPQELLETGTTILLGNTYHLYLRPGDSLIREAGGLHRFISWPGAILTDSGGFQVFSLAELRKITDDGVVFQSHLDGSKHLFTPEKVMEVQRNLGSDIAMVLDECTPYPCRIEEASKAVERSTNWAARSKSHFMSIDPIAGLKQYLFGIVQGSVYPELRKASLEGLLELNFDGYALGGLAVGEPSCEMMEIVKFCTHQLPQNKPRYLMGVGRPQDLVTAIGLGIDMFDCVVPTRNGRNGTVYTWNGKMNLKSQKHESEFSPIDENCSCMACKNFSRAYIRHLFQAGELLAMRLATIHNLTFFAALMASARRAIDDQRFASFERSILNLYPQDENTTTQQPRRQ